MLVVSLWKTMNLNYDKKSKNKLKLKPLWALFK